MSKYPTRQLEKIVASICQKHNLKCQFVSDGWVIQIQKNNKFLYIYGYNFPCNNTTSASICNDKCATSSLLINNNIKCFPHIYFAKGFYDTKELTLCFKKFKNNVVIKPNNGSSGIEVHHCQKLNDFLLKTVQIIDHYPGVAISPFFSYQLEYRTIIYQGKVILTLCKEPIYVIGDGKNNIQTLIKNKKLTCEMEYQLKNTYVPKKNEKVYLNWKHNLSQGGVAGDIDKRTLSLLTPIIKKIDNLLGMKFYSIDFAMINNQPYVVEVNAGVMLEKYSSLDKKKYANCCKIYEKVIIDSLK